MSARHLARLVAGTSGSPLPALEATTHIPRDTDIFEEPPIVEFATEWGTTAEEFWDREMAKAHATLPFLSSIDARYQRFLGQLPEEEALKGRSGLAKDVSKLKRASYTREVSADEQYGASISRAEIIIFEFGSMIGHSCRPNAVVSVNWEDDDGPQLLVRAVTNINQGDVITIDYLAEVSTYVSYKTRTDYLRRWSIKCVCLNCTSDNTASDLRRAIIRKIFSGEFKLVSSQNKSRIKHEECSPEDLDRIKRYVEAVRDEGIRDIRYGMALLVLADAQSKCTEPEFDDAKISAIQALGHFRVGYGKNDVEGGLQDNRSSEIDCLEAAWLQKMKKRDKISRS